MEAIKQLNNVALFLFDFNPKAKKSINVIKM